MKTHENCINNLPNDLINLILNKLNYKPIETLSLLRQVNKQLKEYVNWYVEVLPKKYYLFVTDDILNQFTNLKIGTGHPIV